MKIVLIVIVRTMTSWSTSFWCFTFTISCFKNDFHSLYNEQRCFFSSNDIQEND